MVGSLLGLPAAQAQAVNAPTEHGHTLLLYSYGYGARGVEIFSDGFISAVNEAGESVGEDYFEYLDLQRNPSPQYRRQLADSLVRKYAQRGISAIVTVQQPALDFLLHEGAALAHAAPVLTLQAPEPSEAELHGRALISVLTHFDVQGTLQTALALFPETQRVLIVSGSSPSDRAMAQSAVASAHALAPSLPVERTTDLPLAQIEARTAALPSHSLILFTQFNVDSAGYVAPAYEIEARIIRRANAPVFGLYDFNLKSGGIGGSVYGVHEVGATTARLAMDLEHGRWHSSAAITRQEVAPQAIYNWQQIVHWGGDTSRIPPGATVLNRPLGLWQAHPYTVLATVLALAMLSFLVLALLLNHRRQAETKKVLRAERDLGQLYLKTVPSIMVALDQNGTITMVNAAACAILGYVAEDLVGRNWFSTCLPQPEGAQEVYPYFLRVLKEDDFPTQYENEVVCANGERRSISWHNARLLGAQGEVLGTLSAGEDVTQQRATELEVHTLAFFDPLTGLPNRRLLRDRLQQSIARSRRSGKYRALLFIDLDHFKDLNDSQGHAVGDLLLVEVARRLCAGVREGDTVARLGGDEFVIILEQLSEDAQEAAVQSQKVAGEIVARMAAPFELPQQHYHCTLSMGVALFVGQDVAGDELLQRADMAMYQAKAAGRATVRFFDPAMQQNLAAHTALVNDLRQAIASEQFVLYYQPQVNAHGRCIGAEALIRWNSPQRGFVAPGEFIACAEAMGLITAIGQWVLRTACAQLLAWQADTATRELVIAVNVSVQQFKQPFFVEETLQALAESGARAELLKLDNTESLLIDDVDFVIDKMSRLRAAGIRFALDDFGTGYSSLSYVKRLPLTQLKIDQSFVRDILHDANDASICRAIIALGESMGLNTIAEGVETEAQWDLLRTQGCTLAQGYLFARPMPVAHWDAWLQARPAATA